MSCRNSKVFPLTLVLFPSILLGCASTGLEKGPDGTVSYSILVEASEPGVRIEVNQDVKGEAPLTIKVYGDKDGTFHNFGGYDYVIRAVPTGQNQFAQSKVFRTGGWFTPEDQIPKRVYFDMKQEGFSVNSK